MRERGNTRGTEEILQYIMVFRRIVCICAVVFICIVGKRCIVQAAGYDYPIEKTKEVQELDDDCKDAQGVKYVLHSANRTAQVGANYTKLGSTNLCEYAGANDGVCVIPEKVVKDGVEYEVTKIATSAFDHNITLKVLVVPDTVTQINQYAVSFSAIEYLYLGAGVESDSSAPYHFCEYLREIKVSERNGKLVNLDGVLYTADKKTILMNPACLTGSSLAEYMIPDGVEKVDQYAFAYSKYRKISLPDSLTTVSAYAFFDQDELEELDLTHVEYIGEHAIAGCDSLHKIIFPDTQYRVYSEIIDNGGIMQSLYVKKGIVYSSTSGTFGRLEYLDTLAFEPGTTTIGNRQFVNCKQLQTVLLPDTVTILKSGSFSNCSKLERLYIPPSVTVIGDGVLNGSPTVIYGEKGSTAEEYAKANDITFVDVSDHDHSDLPETVVYEDCYSKVIANYCRECGYAANARQEWKTIDGVLDGTNGEHDFSLEKTKEKVVLDSNRTDTQGLSYGVTQMLSNTILMNGSATVSKMDDGIGVSDVVIPEVIEYNGQDYIVKRISSECFYNSERVKSVVISDTVQEIGSHALSSATLEYVYIGSGVSEMSEYAFLGCTKIKRIWVSPANPRYYVKDHILYDYKGNILCDYTKTAEDSGNKQPTSEPTITTTEKTTQTTESTTESTEKTTQTTESTEKTTQATESTTESTEKTTQASESTFATTERTTQMAELTTTATEKITRKNPLGQPKLKVKKRMTPSGIHYLQLTLKQVKGTYIELQVKKGSGTYKKVRLASSRLSHYKNQLRIGYKPARKKMWLRIRTYNKKKGKKTYSDWSKPVVVK